MVLQFSQVSTFLFKTQRAQSWSQTGYVYNSQKRYNAANDGINLENDMLGDTDMTSLSGRAKIFRMEELR